MLLSSSDHRTPQALNLAAGAQDAFSWGLMVATARAIQPSTGGGSQREGQSVNKMPLRKGAPLISQQGRLSREGGKGKRRGAAGYAGAWKQDPAQGFLQAA